MAKSRSKSAWVYEMDHLGLVFKAREGGTQSFMNAVRALECRCDTYQLAGPMVRVCCQDTAKVQEVLRLAGLFGLQVYTNLPCGKHLASR